MKTTIHTLAKEMSDAFESGTRTTSGEMFRKLRKKAPDWMTTVCRMAHDDGSLLPDDWRYQFIEDALNALSQFEDTDEALASLEPDIYTNDLTAWLHSCGSRVYYLGEAMREFGSFRDGFQLLAAAQMIEKEETFRQVVDALEEQLDEQGGQT